MDKVYVVTEGSYSDYGIVAVFSDRAEAQAFADENTGYQGRYVEDWPLCAVQDDAYVWQVRIAKDGTTNYAQRLARSDEVHEARKVRGQDGLLFEGYGKTEEHARRSAEDLRREYLITKGL